MPMLYDVGDVVKVSSVFTNQSGTAVDPAQVKFRSRDPEGVITIYTYGTDIEVVKTATGNYYLSLPLTKPGTWNVRFEGNTTNRGAAETEVIVRPSAFFNSAGSAES